MFTVTVSCDVCQMPIAIEYGRVDDLEDQMTTVRPQVDPFALDIDGDQPHLCSEDCRRKYAWRQQERAKGTQP